MNNQLHLSLNHAPCKQLFVCVRESERDREATEENSRGLAEGKERLFFPVYSSGQSLLKWLCWVMTLGSSETFACCRKRAENARLPVYPNSTATTHLTRLLFWPHQNNEKVDKTESDSHSNSTMHWAHWQDTDTTSLDYNNTQCCLICYRHSTSRCHWRHPPFPVCSV